MHCCTMLRIFRKPFEGDSENYLSLRTELIDEQTDTYFYLIFSSQGAKQKFEFLEKKGKSMMAIRKIRQFDEDFDPKVFAEKAQEIYVDAHKALAE